MNLHIQILLAGIVLAGAWNPANAQGNALELIRVEFWAPQDKAGHWVRIRKDGLSGEELSGEFKTNAWFVDKTGAIVKKPVAYAAGATPRAGACFRILGSGKFCPPASDPGGSAPTDPAPYFVRGVVVDASGQPTGMVFPTKQLTKTGTKKVFEYRAEPATSAFPDQQVQFMEQYRIRWEWSPSGDENGAWTQAGISDNRLYVTHRKPLERTPFFYTCLHLGCTEAHSETNEAAIVAAVQAKFASRCIARVDDAQNNCLKYWGDPFRTRQNRGLEYLLENASGADYEDGRCQEWAEFFQKTLAAQGISGNLVTALAYNPAGTTVGVFDNAVESTYLTRVEQFFGNDLFPTPNHPTNPTNVLLDNGDPVFNLPGSGTRVILHGTKATPVGGGQEELVVISQFFVKNWNFSAGENQFYAVLPAGQPLSIKDANNQQVAIAYGADESGAEAQSNGNPTAHFDDHVLFRHNNQYYDPSYGNGPFPDKDNWVTVSLTGYGSMILYLAPDNARYFLLWVHENADNTNSGIIKFK